MKLGDIWNNWGTRKSKYYDIMENNPEIIESWKERHGHDPKIEDYEKIVRNLYKRDIAQHLIAYMRILGIHLNSGEIRDIIDDSYPKLSSQDEQILHDAFDVYYPTLKTTREIILSEQEKEHRDRIRTAIADAELWADSTTEPK